MAVRQAWCVITAPKAKEMINKESNGEDNLQL
jgi:hypothetical protein